MIEHGQRRFDVFRFRNGELIGPAEHDDRYAETARREQLGIGGRAATVLAHDRVDAMRLQQFQLTSLAEGPPAENMDGIGDGERRVDRIDAADKIEMLGRMPERGEFLTPERQEHPAGHLAERANRAFGIRHRQPAIPFGRQPSRAIEPQDRHPGDGRSVRGICRYTHGVRVSRIDEKRDALVAQIGGEALRSAEAAAADGNRLSGRLLGAAGKRKGHCKIAARGKLPGQLPGFGGTAEDQYAVGHHAF